MPRLGRARPPLLERPYSTNFPPAPWAPFFDNTGVSAQQYLLASGTAFTWTQNATAGACAIVAAYCDPFSGGSTTGATAVVTFGGATMIDLGNANITEDGQEGYVRVWGLAGVTGGSNQTVSMKFTQSGDTWTGYGASFTYNQVTSVGPLQTATGVTNPNTVSVPSGLGQRVWGTVFNADGNSITNFSLTSIRQGGLAAANNYPAFIAGDSPGNSSVTVSATQGAENLATPVYAAAGLTLYGRQALSTNNIDISMSNSSIMR